MHLSRCDHDVVGCDLHGASAIRPPEQLPDVSDPPTPPSAGGLHARAGNVVLNLVMGKLYDRQARAQGGASNHDCHGHVCYQSSFLTMVGFSAALILATELLWLRHRRRPGA